ncbi:MAG: energy transducer TonB [Terriglobales bacterium]
MSGVTRWWAVAILVAVLTLFVSPALAVEGRKLKVKVQPSYPELAKRMRLTGTVRVEVTIAPTGKIKATRVIGGNPVLVEAAIDALRKWKYEPGADETTEIVEFRFAP